MTPRHNQTWKLDRDVMSRSYRLDIIEKPK
jgi:hypothetical protein